MGIVANQWMFVPAAGEHEWTVLGSKLADNLNGLIVANFNGQGHDDIARLVPVQVGTYELQVSYEGTSNWQTIRTLPAGTSFAGLGQFDDQPGTELVHLGRSLSSNSFLGDGSGTRDS